MSKRFTDSTKWDDPWFAELPNHYKLLWIFILDKCDHAGIYKVNVNMANFCLDYKYNLKKIIELLNNRIYVINDKKWFIPKFIDYQYGELQKQNRAHNSVIQILKKEGLYKPLNRGIAEDKEQDKDKIKGKDKENNKEWGVISKEKWLELKKNLKKTRGG